MRSQQRRGSGRWRAGLQRRLGCAILALLLAALASSAGVVQQVSDTPAGRFGPPALDDAGSEVFFVTSEDLTGGNPQHGFQIFIINPTTGAATQLTDFDIGATEAFFGVAVSDDGQTIAFLSDENLTGNNADRSDEIFLIQRDGSGLTQLTTNGGQEPGAVLCVFMAGDGSRVVYVSDGDPLGTNPQRRRQLFSQRTNGSGLVQLTQTTSGVIPLPAISDDGQRIVFLHDGDLTGGNPDGNFEVFAVQADGTGLSQLTAGNLDVEHVVLSGNGQKVAYGTENDVIWTINWTGGPATVLGNGAIHPSINDDGTVVIAKAGGRLRSYPASGGASTEIGTVTGQAEYPIVSGNGAQIAYIDRSSGLPQGNPDGGPELMAITSQGRDQIQLTNNTLWPRVGTADITDDGSTIVYASEGNPLGTNPNNVRQIFRVELGDDGKVDRSTLRQVTNGSTDAFEPTISADGNWIAFGRDRQAWVIHADGSGEQQLSNCGGSGFTRGQHISADGSRIVYHFIFCDPFGTNTDESGEIAVVNRDGSNNVQLTDFAASNPVSNYSYWPRVDASGDWLTFSGFADLTGQNADLSFEIFRMRSDGSNLEQLTDSAPEFPSFYPDISSDGQRIAFLSREDLTGTNPDHNIEVFLYEATTSTMRQLTHTTGRDNREVRISGDGDFVYFRSIQPYFQVDAVPAPDYYRIEIDTGKLERVGGLRLGWVPEFLDWWPAVDKRNRLVDLAFEGWAGTNPDRADEIFLFDMGAAAVLRISDPVATRMDWDVETGPRFYDAIRGNLAELSDAGGSISLGSVVCIENDSADTTTAGSPDSAVPAVGEAFFYLYRGMEGAAVPGGAYGSSSAGFERLPASGDCAP